MYVMPSGRIELYAGVPLRDDYQNTFRFKDEAAQRTYFTSKKVIELTDQLYTRKSNGLIRVAYNYADLQNVDYLSFLNHGTTSHQNKRYYCFVVDMEYVNENLTEIYFTIDVIQTFMFNLTFKPSYIEREHVPPFEDLLFFKNAEFDTQYPILPQNVDIGEYQFYPLTFPAGSQYPDVFGEFTYVVAATFDKNFNSAVGGLQNGFYSGLKFNVFDNITDINNFLLAAASNNKSDGIVNVYMSPKAFVENPATTEVAAHIRKDIWDSVFNDLTTYTPKNKILYCWPFCKIVWTDNNGNTAEYNPQMFYNFYTESGVAYYEFKITYVCAGANEVSVYPSYYKGLEKNYNEQIVMNLTPQCAYATDSYRAWLAQNSAKMGVERNYAEKLKMNQDEKATYTYSFTVRAAGLAKDTGDLGLVEKLANSVSSWFTGYNRASVNKKVAQLAEDQALNTYALDKLNNRNDYNRTIGLLNAAAGVASTMPPHANGNASGMAGTVSGAYRLSCYLCVPSPSMTKKLDQYFDMFGYRVDRLETPILRTRKYWNYIKCAMFNAEGTNIPDVYFDAIKNVFEAGITFWHDTTHYLDYSQNNHESFVD